MRNARRDKNTTLTSLEPTRLESKKLSRIGLEAEVLPSAHGLTVEGPLGTVETQEPFSYDRTEGLRVEGVIPRAPPSEEASYLLPPY